VEQQLCWESQGYPECPTLGTHIIHVVPRLLTARSWLPSSASQITIVMEIGHVFQRYGNKNLSQSAGVCTVNLRVDCHHPWPICGILRRFETTKWGALWKALYVENDPRDIIGRTVTMRYEPCVASRYILLIYILFWGNEFNSYNGRGRSGIDRVYRGSALLGHRLAGKDQRRWVWLA
jgi:hypothetical protein